MSLIDASPETARASAQSTTASKHWRFSNTATRFLARCVQGLTWHGVGVMVVFCAIYGISLSPNRIAGGPPTLAAYLIGSISALTYFFPVFLAAIVAANFAPKSLLSRTLVLGLTVVISAFIARHLMLSMLGILTGRHVGSSWGSEMRLSFVMCFLGLGAMLLLEREQIAAEALHEAEEQRLNIARQLAEAQLQVLQMQIEPHFLFNSLAHVRRLYQTDPRAGRATMQHLSRYLSTALLALRDSSIRLSDDVELAAAYLNVQKIRLGARLVLEIDVSPEAGEARVPPLTITTLVENAIKHGIAPLSEGGSVRIVARSVGQTTSVQVADTGRGFQTSMGAGVGLANIRARLATLHGTAAELSLCQNTPQGVIATVVVPTWLHVSRQ